MFIYLKNMSNVKVKSFSTNKKILFIWNIKVLALTVQMLIARLKFRRSNSKVQIRNFGTHRKVFSYGILMWNIKALDSTHGWKVISKVIN